MAGLAKVYAFAYFHDGTWSSFRERRHGRPVDVFTTPSYRFIVFAQDHDQIGNRAVGDRLPAILESRFPGEAAHREGLLRVAAGLVLLSPYTPMLFMGEEWGAGTPWQYFTDHADPFFADAVSQGRRSEFVSHGWDFDDVPDPQDAATFQRSKLDWSEAEREPHASLLTWHRRLLALRKSRPELTDPYLAAVRAEFDEDARWLLVHRGSLRIAVNLGSSPATIPVAGASGLLLASDPDVSVKPDSVVLPPASLAVAESVG
jgi:maltooligosyltrehalose trehalohydrolase